MENASANSLLVNFQEKINSKGMAAEGSSVNSASDMHIQKEAFVSIINSKNYTAVMNNIVYFAIFSVITLSSVTTILFFTVKNNFETELYNFNTIVTSTNLMSEFASMIKENEFLRLDNFQMFLTNLSDAKK